MTVNSTEYENSTNELKETRRLMPTGIVIFLLGLNICLSIAASLGNTLIIIALQKVSSIHSPTKLLFQKPGGHGSLRWSTCTAPPRLNNNNGFYCKGRSEH